MSLGVSSAVGIIAWLIRNSILRTPEDTEGGTDPVCPKKPGVIIELYQLNTQDTGREEGK